MHEYSIVQSLMELIEGQVRTHGGGSVKRVSVKIGVLSGVEPHLFQIAFDTFKEGTICDGAQLEMVIQPIVAECLECGGRSSFEENQIFFQCQRCGGVQLELLDGEEMVLMELEIEGQSEGEGNS
ncbi:MAG: hydrogenase maturation nickel metallochaperone HypA [Epsilonproteobacteria bacterium]|nr:hydrogenase maturation nickel metallochaperone HypA [Campylobacterota bacterium]NPA57624.1 hydrogenase maturation nickel metallochaperone HypA [Campylobacterota bacterium]